MLALIFLCVFIDRDTSEIYCMQKDGWKSGEREDLFTKITTCRFKISPTFTLFEFFFPSYYEIKYIHVSVIICSVELF